LCDHGRILALLRSGGLFLDPTAGGHRNVGRGTVSGSFHGRNPLINAGRKKGTFYVYCASYGMGASQIQADHQKRSVGWRNQGGNKEVIGNSQERPGSGQGLRRANRFDQGEREKISSPFSRGGLEGGALGRERRLRTAGSW